MPSMLVRALREPLLHFTVLAAALFAVAALTRRDDDVIQVTRQELDYRIQQVEAQEGVTLNDEERAAVEEAYIDERVLIREALAMGLEADARIDDVLVQKMLHILSGDVIQPTDAQLQEFYDQNAERYATDPSFTLDEVVVSGSALPRALLQGTPPDQLPTGALVGNRVLDRMTSDDLSQAFGADVAAKATAAEPGAWWEALQSTRGTHWLRVRERFEAQIPPIDVVRDAVRLDWIAEREQDLLLARVGELRANYSVVVEGR